MNIGIDVRSLLEGTRTGVGEYLYNLLKNLIQIDSQNQYKLFSNAYRSRDLGIAEILKKKNVKLHEFRYPNRFLNFSFRFFNYPKIDTLLKEVDLFFSPNINFCALSPNTKQVVTFHDLSFKRDKTFFSAKKRWWHYFVNPENLAFKASKIITDSHSSKEDLIEFFGVENEKIRVIYLGLENKFEVYPKDSIELLHVKDKYNLPEKFILFLGTLEPRKNLVSLISAFEGLKKETKIPYSLVIAGGKGWLYEDILSRRSRSAFKEEIIFTDFVDDRDKVGFYNLADLFVYPSFYEGFGFPPLEAMASGIPVVTSACSSLPEVCGEAALLVDPYNINEMSLAMKSILEDEELRNSLVRKGLEQARKFSWEKTARETLEVFEETVNSNH